MRNDPSAAGFSPLVRSCDHLSRARRSAQDQRAEARGYETASRESHASPVPLDTPHASLDNTRMPTRKIAVFPGQFDPITNGHLDVIRRAVTLFDELIVAVGINPDKREFFTVDERLDLARQLTQGIPGVRVEGYTGLTVHFVRRMSATAILRGIRDVSDLRYEFQLALANRTVGGVETVFIMTGDQYAFTSSSLIRQVVGLGGDVRSLATVLPEVVIRQLEKKQKSGETPVLGDGDGAAE